MTRIRRVLGDNDGQHLLGFIIVRRCTIPGPHRSGGFWPRLWRRPRAQAPLPLQLCTWGMIDACCEGDTYRRQRIGAALGALAWCHGRGLSRVALGVLANNPTAQAFWAQCGLTTYRLLMQQTVPAP